MSQRSILAVDEGIFVKINFWCGRQVLEGWYNVDAILHPAASRQPDLLHQIIFDEDGQIVNKLPLDDGIADELMAIHAIEHVYKWEMPNLLLEFRRLLRPGGKLILELPNLEAACHNILSGMEDKWGMWPLYGDPSHKNVYMCHRWAYSPASLSAILKDCGFSSIKSLPPQTHGRKINRDMRIEAIR